MDGWHSPGQGRKSARRNSATRCELPFPDPAARVLDRCLRAQMRFRSLALWSVSLPFLKSPEIGSEEVPTLIAATPGPGWSSDQRIRFRPRGSTTPALRIEQKCSMIEM